MKLRIRGNSLRLRISRSEMERLFAAERLAETIHFAPQPGASLTYALEHRAAAQSIAVEYRAQQVIVVLDTQAAAHWRESDEAGIYGSTETGHGPLELIVEKDYACLDGDDPRDYDPFPNPNAGTDC